MECVLASFEFIDTEAQVQNGSTQSCTVQIFDHQLKANIQNLGRDLTPA